MTTQSTRPMYGHTLLELLIALPLGLCVTLVSVSLYRTQRASFEQVVELQQLAEAGWAALHLMSTHLRMTGFTSPLSQTSSSAEKARPALGYNADRSTPSPSTAARYGTVSAPPQHFSELSDLFGCTGARPVEVAGQHSCKVSPGMQSDGIEIRYEADTVSTWRSAQGKPTDCLGQVLATENHGTQAQVINRFFARLSPSTGKPELYCEGSGRPGVAQPVIEGVERLQLRYQLAQALNWVEASAIAQAQWNQVALVQLCVVMRGTRRAVQARYMGCDGNWVAAADGLLRRTLTTWVAVRNGPAG